MESEFFTPTKHMNLYTLILSTSNPVNSCMEIKVLQDFIVLQGNKSLARILLPLGSPTFGYVDNYLPLFKRGYYRKKSIFLVPSGQSQFGFYKNL